MLPTLFNWLPAALRTSMLKYSGVCYCVQGITQGHKKIYCRNARAEVMSITLCRDLPVVWNLSHYSLARLNNFSTIACTYNQVVILPVSIFLAMNQTTCP